MPSETLSRLVETPLPPLSRLLVALSVKVAIWETRARTRKGLTDLPQHLLDDIGIDRARAEAEARSPFWR